MSFDWRAAPKLFGRENPWPADKTRPIAAACRGLTCLTAAKSTPRAASSAPSVPPCQHLAEKGAPRCQHLAREIGRRFGEAMILR